MTGHLEIDPATGKAISLRIADHPCGTTERYISQEKHAFARLDALKKAQLSEQRPRGVAWRWNP